MANRAAFLRRAVALTEHARRVRRAFYGGRVPTIEDGWDFYAEEGDDRRLARLRDELRRAGRGPGDE